MTPSSESFALALHSGAAVEQKKIAFFNRWRGVSQRVESVDELKIGPEI
jgi:hypothetical protein